MLDFGLLYRDHPDFPKPPSYAPDYKFELDNQNLVSLKSAYKEFFGKEPDFTNYAWVDFSSEQPFIDTLDYILFTDDFTVQTCRELRPRDHQVITANGPQPNAAEPSDHLLIAATLLPMNLSSDK